MDGFGSGCVVCVCVRVPAVSGLRRRRRFCDCCTAPRKVAIKSLELPTMVLSIAQYCTLLAQYFEAVNGSREWPTFLPHHLSKEGAKNNNMVRQTPEAVATGGHDFAVGGNDFLERLAFAEARDSHRMLRQQPTNQAAGERKVCLNDGGFMKAASTRVAAPPGGPSCMSHIFGTDNHADKQAAQQRQREGRRQQAMQEMQQQQQRQQRQQQQQGQQQHQEQHQLRLQQQRQQQQQQQHEQTLWQQQMLMQKPRPRAQPLMATAQIARPAGAARRACGDCQPIGMSSASFGIVDYRPGAVRVGSPRHGLGRAQSPRRSASPRCAGAAPSPRQHASGRLSPGALHASRHSPSTRRPPGVPPLATLAAQPARARTASPQRDFTSSTKIHAPPGGVSSISLG